MAKTIDYCKICGSPIYVSFRKGTLRTKTTYTYCETCGSPIYIRLRRGKIKAIYTCSCDSLDSLETDDTYVDGTAGLEDLYDELR